MKVTNNQSPSVDKSSSAAQTQQARDAKKSSDPKKTESNGDPTSVKSDISARAQEMAKAKEIATNASDVREEKIAELKRRIANKEYNVKPADIADRMIEDHKSLGGA